MIAILDYGAGNLGSVEKALHFIGCDCVITHSREIIAGADAVILPGVGSFGDCMHSMRARGLDAAALEAAHSGKPFLGICLGLQLLFESSEESPGISGLGLLKGKIRRIPSDGGLKVPHIGWNSLQISQRNGIFRSIDQNTYVYFVHSYYLDAADKTQVAATTEYGVTIDAAIQTGNIYATQFHPEKSGNAGLEMLRNFVSITREKRG